MIVIARGPNSASPLALGINIDHLKVDRVNGTTAGDPVVATDRLSPCYLNTWILESQDSCSNKNGEPLRYGDSFAIRLNGTSLYVEVDVPMPSTPRGTCGYITPKLGPRICANTRCSTV